ncbi:MAG: NifU family protein [Mycoplasmataceae bacterium]|jgi:Fe-S cluster biogenesis protein NfuA|nr:NifU family protein [Mycoplasmataceae bacterium]
MKSKILKVIDKLRVYLQNDGGDMEFESYDSKSKILKIKVKGACVGCPYFENTFDSGIKQAIQIELPFIKEILFI